MPVTQNPGWVFAAELSCLFIWLALISIASKGSKAERMTTISTILSGFFCLLVGTVYLFGILPVVCNVIGLGRVATLVLVVTPLYVLFHKMERGPNLPDVNCGKQVMSIG